MSREWFQRDPYQLRLWPDDSSLRLRAKEVTLWDDPAGPEASQELRALVIGMGTAMYANGGAGLAAPQVGVQRRVVVLKETDVKKGTPGRRPQKKVGAFALLNPRVVERMDGADEDEEGCLSLPGLTVVVERAVRVIVESESIFGETMRVEMVGREARVVQHEIDHLDGRLIIDYLERDERRKAAMQMAHMLRDALAQRQRMIENLLAA